MKGVSTDWSEVAVLISAIAAVPAVGNFLHLLSRENGRTAKRMRVLEQANLQVRFWRDWLDVRSNSLSEELLNEVRREASDAVERARKIADHNLSILKQSRSPIPVIGLSTWRVMFLIYPPVSNARFRGYYNRFLFYLSLAAVAWVVSVVVRLIVIHHQMASVGQAAAFWREIVSHRFPQQTFFLLTISVTSAYLSHYLVRYEDLDSRTTYIERI